MRITVVGVLVIVAATIVAIFVIRSISERGPSGSQQNRD